MQSIIGGQSSLFKKFTIGWPLSTVNGSVCVSTEAQATPNLTEGVEMPAGLVRPGSSPAASLTVDWQQRVLVSVVGWVPVPGCEDPVAILQPDDGLNDIPNDHTHSIAYQGVLVPTQHLVHEAGYDNQPLHRQNNQLAICVAVQVHSAAALLGNDFRRQQAISIPAASFLY